MVFDVAIIGAGVIGCSTARELSRYALSIAVFDKESDVGEGTSKANSAIIHGGYDPEPGTLKARLNLLGNEMMDDISRDLDIPFKRCGALVICLEGQDPAVLEALYNQGVKNGVKGLKILSREEAIECEPQLSDEVIQALYVPNSGIVCPFEMTIAYAENAAANGVNFRLAEEVLDISRENGLFTISTSKDKVQARCVINCAGVYADKIHDLVCAPSFKITARKGEYLLLDKTAGQTVSHTIFRLPDENGKGILVSPTVHGNLLAGPTAIETPDREDAATTREGLTEVKSVAAHSVKDIPFNKVITSFCGLRATGDRGDFIIREDERVPLFFDVAGIESPGLSSAPAIAVYVRDMVSGRLEAVLKDDFLPIRRGIPKISHLPLEERQKLIRENPEYGQIICRCEQISEGEIRESIRRTPGAVTLDGVKRRVRTGMGRCQAGFCTPRVMAILSEELGIACSEIKKNG